MSFLPAIDWIALEGGFWKFNSSMLLHPDGPETIRDASVPTRLVGFQTSGSSGRPKWIALSHDALLSSAAAVNFHLGADHNSCWGLALPWHHVGGFGVLARTWQARCRLSCLQDRWNPQRFADWLTAGQVTHVSAVPTQIHDLVTHSVSAPAGLAAVIVGGGKLEPQLAAAARALGWPVLASYGMTEAASQIATQAMANGKPAGDGRVLPVLPHWQVRVTECQLLEISGPALFAGILEPQDDGWSWHPRQGDWFRTQDRVEPHPGGLIPLGRADHRIKVLGELVDPEEIESELLSLAGHDIPPGCLAVTGEPDPRSQHRLVLLATTSIPDATVAELLQRYHARSPGFRRIQRLLRPPTLPLSPLGKLRRGELARLVGTCPDA